MSHLFMEVPASGISRCLWCGENPMKVRSDFADAYIERDCLSIKIEAYIAYDTEDYDDIYAVFEKRWFDMYGVMPS